MIQLILLYFALLIIIYLLYWIMHSLSPVSYFELFPNFQTSYLAKEAAILGGGLRQSLFQMYMDFWVVEAIKLYR